MQSIKTKLYTSNWIGYLTTHIVVTIFAIIFPNDHDTTFFNYLFWVNILQFLSGIIPFLVFLIVVLILDYVLFKIEAIETFFIQETIILLSITLLLLYFGGVISNQATLVYISSIILSQFFRYRYIKKQFNS